jgi:hypothetical protein
MADCLAAASSQVYTITPSFELSVLPTLTQPTNSGNGLESNLEGMISSIGVDGRFTVASMDGFVWSVGTSTNTLFQGVAGFSSLAAGVPVDMDAVQQDDGTLLAGRVAVLDPSATTLTAWRGPLAFVSNAVPEFDVLPAAVKGALFPVPAGATGMAAGAVGAFALGMGSATFSVSPQFTNLSQLPFAATFSATNASAGQNVYISTHAASFPNSPNPVAATTITLMPQTIDGTVVAVSAAGAFNIYTVALATYDVFPTLAQQSGQTTLLSDPGTVVVYMDGATQALNTTPLAVGSVLRFNGIVFDDAGTLRMDCAEVLDGVAP